MRGGGGGCDSRQRQVAVADGADVVFTDTPSDPTPLVNQNSDKLPVQLCPRQEYTATRKLNTSGSEMLTSYIFVQQFNTNFPIQKEIRINHHVQK